MAFGLWPLAFGLWLAREARFRNSFQLVSIYASSLHIYTCVRKCVFCTKSFSVLSARPRAYIYICQLGSICVSSSHIYAFSSMYIYVKKNIHFHKRAHVLFLRVGECARVCMYARTRARVSPRGRALKVCVARRAAEQGSAQGGCEFVKFVSGRRAKPRKCTVFRKN